MSDVFCFGINSLLIVNSFESSLLRFKLMKDKTLNFSSAAAAAGTTCRIPRINLRSLHWMIIPHFTLWLPTKGTRAPYEYLAVKGGTAQRQLIQIYVNLAIKTWKKMFQHFEIIECCNNSHFSSSWRERWCLRNAKNVKLNFLFSDAGGRALDDIVKFHEIYSHIKYKIPHQNKHQFSIHMKCQRAWAPK